MTAMSLAFRDDGFIDELAALKPQNATQLGVLSTALAPFEIQIKETLARTSVKELVPIIKNRLTANGARVPSDLTIKRYLLTLGGGPRQTTLRLVQGRWERVQRELNDGMPISKIGAMLAVEIGRSPGTVEKAITRIINTKTHDAT